MLPTVFFVLGLVCGYLTETHIAINLVAFLTLSAGTFLVKNKIANAFLFPCLFFLLACLMMSLEKVEENPYHFSKGKNSEINVVIQKKEKTTRGFRYFTKVTSCSGDQDNICKGRLLIYTDSTIHLQLFNTYELPAHYKRILTFENPDRFDYGTFLAHQNIYHSAYLKKQPEEIHQCNFILKAVRASKVTAGQFFSENIELKDGASIINAILIGEKSDLEKNIKDLFINNGLAHLLAISGMHVGIVLIILNFMIFKLPSPILKKTIVLLGIWFYILLTGLQVPAMRAGFMFTIYLLGQLINRNTKGLNSVFFAALVLLSIQPKLILQLSFQLSFSAMISILLFYAPIRNLFQVGNRLVSVFWDLLALNISVQLLVLPLSIFYFEQIPTYSILASLASAPFIIITMWASTFALIFSHFEFIAKAICRILEVILDYYIHLLQFFASLPKSLIQNVDIGLPQIITWTFGSIFALYIFQTKLFTLRASLMGFVPILIVSSLMKISNHSKNTIIIYDDDKQVIIDHQSSNGIVRHKEVPSLYSYAVENKSDDNIELRQLDNHFKIAGLTLLMVGKQVAFTANEKIDFCIIKTSSIIDSLEQKCKHIILPRNITQSHIYKNQYDIKARGAFVINLKRK